MNEWINEWMNKRFKEWTSDWMNERMKSFLFIIRWKHKRYENENVSIRSEKYSKNDG